MPVNEKPRVYIASPYTKGDTAINVRFQLAVFDELLSLGVVPIAPLWSHFQHLSFPRPYEHWLAYDREIVSRCDICLRLVALFNEYSYQQAESSGADSEVRYFIQAGKPVYYSIQDLKAALAAERGPN